VVVLLLAAGPIVAGAAVSPPIVSFEWEDYDCDPQLTDCTVSGEMAHVGTHTGLPPGGVVSFGSVAPTDTVLEFQVSFDPGPRCVGQFAMAIEGDVDGFGNIGTPPAFSWMLLPPGSLFPDAYGILVDNDIGSPPDCDSSPITFPFFAAIEPSARFGDPGGSWICYSAPDDDDCDGVPNASDVCPAHYDPDQLDSDSDGLGDACNHAVDGDRDGWADALDNCPLAPNNGQEDGDGDGEGDACEPGSSDAAPVFRVVGGGSPLGISPEGDVVVGTQGAGTEEVCRIYSGGYTYCEDLPKTQAFRWARGSSTALDSGVGLAQAYDASFGGGVVVGATQPHLGWDYGGAYTGGRWTGAPYEVLSAGADAGARGVSYNGSVIVHGHERREGATLSDLGGLPGASATESHDVSADGSVVVGSCTISPQLVQRAFRWEGGTMDELGDLPGGGEASVARAVSADGRVVVGYASAAGGQRAFRWQRAFGWQEGVMLDLGVLPGTTSSIAHAVSRDGSVIVGQSGNTAFIWDAVHGMRELRAVLTGVLGVAGVPSLASANGISNDGTTIVGSSVSNAGWIVHHASLAPASSEVPGLTGWGIGIAMAALLGMGARRLKR
jgi:probable HAF family extracellular repeat protein